jgi:hypothetical protein
MARIRNPRYAPEFLERKLSPTDLGLGLTATVQVSPLTTTVTTTAAIAKPIVFPQPSTTGPSGPA